MPNPCPDCTQHSAWGCKTHAPKHMEAGRIEARLEAIQDVLGPLALPNESEADVARRIAAKAALWDEVRPLLKSEYAKDPKWCGDELPYSLQSFCDGHYFELEAL